MPALRLIAFVVLAACGMPGHAVGLGAIRVQSGLGQPLRASIPLFGGDNNDVGDTCIKARLESLDGTFIVAPKVSLARGASATTIVLSSPRDVNEPAVTLAVEIGCTTPIQRSYQLLLDPPTLQGPQTVHPEATASASRPEARMPLAATEAAPTQAPWDDKYLLRKKVKGGAGKPRAATEKSVLTRSLGGMAAPRDVLKIADDSIVGGARLRLSDSLSEPAAAVDPARAEENRKAQQRFAALLRGEDPAVVAEDKTRAAQSRVQPVQPEAAKSQLQTRADKNSLDAVRERSFSSTFVFSLAGLLLLSLGAVGWLGWRLRRNAASSGSGWWENAAAGDEVFEQKQSPSLSESPSAIAPQYAAAVVPEASPFDELAEQRRELDELMSAHVQEDVAPMPMPVAAAPQPVETAPSIAVNPFAVKVAALKVEEISDVTQEAEFWMSLNDPQRALDILETQSEVERPVSPVPWLYLLDLYRETGNQAKYEALRTRFKRLFNALIPEFAEPKAANPRTLEDFPHLVKRISETWGGPDSLPFLESLLVDDRDGARVGFELPVYRDILLLISIAAEWAHSGSVTPLLSDAEQQAYLIPEQEAPLAIDVGLPDIAVPEIVPPVADNSNPESALQLEEIHFEPMDFNIDISPKTA